MNKNSTVWVEMDDVIAWSRTTGDCPKGDSIRNSEVLVKVRELLSGALAQVDFEITAIDNNNTKRWNEETGEWEPVEFLDREILDHKDAAAPNIFDTEVRVTVNPFLLKAGYFFQCFGLKRFSDWLIDKGVRAEPV